MNERVAQRLRAASEDGPGDLRLSLRELLQLHGEASGAVLLMLMALLSTAPIAGAGTVLSLGIFALAWAWLRGHDSLQLPDKLAEQSRHSLILRDGDELVFSGLSQGDDNSTTRSLAEQISPIFGGGVKAQQQAVRTFLTIRVRVLDAV